MYDILVDINATPEDNQNISLADAGRTLAESADFTRGGTPPIPDHDASERERSERIAAEQQKLILWAKAKGKLGGKIPKDDVGGGEHIVRIGDKAERVFKATQLYKQKGYGIALGSLTHGATPSEYLDRLILQNQIFNDDIRLERVVLRDGKPVIVTSQPAIKGIPPTQLAIDATMEAKGFEKFISGAYYDSDNGFFLFDLFPKNAMQGSDGIIYPFDPVIQRITLEFASFLREFPDRIHNR